MTPSQHQVHKAYNLASCEHSARERAINALHESSFPTHAVRPTIHSTQELFMNHNTRTHFTELLGCAQRSRPVRISLVLLLVAVACFAQDPFSALGQGAQTISTGTFVTGCVELAIVVGGILLAFSGRVLGGVLIAIIGGGMLALSATKWMGWIQSL
jgi:hypothetical protein